MNSTIDSQWILQKFDNDFTLVKAVTTAFFADAPTDLHAVGEAIKKLDAKELANAVHAVKGAARNFSLDLVVDVAGKMELLAREGRFSEAATLHGQLLTEVEQLIDALKRLLQYGPSSE